MFRVSNVQDGYEVDVKCIVDSSVDSGLPHDRAIAGFADAIYSAVLGGDCSGLDAARAEMVDAMGAEAMSDGAGSAATFMQMVRLADLTGIPLDAGAGFTDITAEIDKELGTRDFQSADKTKVVVDLV